ncbi:hypothetical protein EB118_19495 [bacterium]|nr:hypothetical protein [bacterium]NDD83751.1 hypothetical protein [bacterium]NDG32248.1 hypothetical protein [bacterium]
MTLCKYKDIFGKPGMGVHAHRTFGLATVDLGLTLAAAWYVSVKYNVPFHKTAIGLIILGVIFHKLFCVDTALNNFLFN